MQSPDAKHDEIVEATEVAPGVVHTHSTKPPTGEVTSERLLRGECLIPAVTALAGPARGEPWVTLSEDARHLIKARLQIAKQPGNNGQVKIAGQPYGTAFLSRALDAAEGRLNMGRVIDSEATV
ncbi:MAG: hypothetical protein QF741_02390 [Candidatus Peribacteraceae bacterium]|jgi:hypothetical protein|nr:hypothetical protein [Candidatus Peribacteraceae bacterium]MDP7454504.1 hypothetical protein [Candidatus Peribacteraceae bacterium]MDP7646283.1 hypothetical protein [Candidatus Peribacteraceae bacterium]|tara:strand:+ start:490 stop:861 length:372 start_codon:yes stop_codon:yes gene_type:complete